MLRSHTQASGFSLIEVLVALSVLAIGVAGSAKLSELGYNHIAASQNYNQAGYFAHTHLTTLGAATSYQTLGPAYQQGAYNARFNWELNLTAIEPETPADITYLRVVPTRADLTIWFEDDTRSIQFHSLIMAPAIAQAQLLASKTSQENTGDSN